MDYSMLTVEQKIELAKARVLALSEAFPVRYECGAVVEALTLEQVINRIETMHPRNVEIHGGSRGGCINREMLMAPFLGTNHCWDDRIKEIWNQTERAVKIAVQPKRPPINKSVVQLANSVSAVDAIRQGLIGCGFELEFQALNGHNKEDGTETDFDALAEASHKAWGNIAWDEFESYVSGVDRSVARLIDCATDIVDNSWENLGPNNLRDLFDGELCTKVEQVIERAEERFRIDWEESNSSDYQKSGMYDSLEAVSATRRVIDLGTDQSVDGGEIRTKGALSPMEFLKAAADLMDNNKFDVDTGCSFHIHLSVPGVKHSYGQELQAEMTAYLLENKARLPDGVRERLTSSKVDKFARLQLSREKFTAVHFHPQGTWEFRLFGNVNEAAEARRCLIMAIEALRHAYRVKLGLTPSLVDKAIMANFEDASVKARNEGQTFKGVARKARIDNRNAA